MELKDIISLSFNVGVPVLLLGTTWITQSEIIRARRKYLSEQEEYYRKNGINRRKNEHIYSAGK